MISVPEGMGVIAWLDWSLKRPVRVGASCAELFCSGHFAVEAVLFEFFVKCVAVDAEAAGGFDLYALAFDKDLSDHFAFDGIDDAAVDVDRFARRLR